ncbi:L-aminopeptidase/D-esterase [Chelatococcus sambhunathii]|uniref:L-aminopeptidase/D-esterase n=1 Tax=Chelatococcus sambhunathii TaxID=363953 RepID=A0ABP2A151_9HYPH|nr:MULTISPECIES: P1 family peptidase [Chelatococcus]CUA83901.1 L-aminopeptidase/D-esterase [Chelatococcus sambhunathii]
MSTSRNLITDVPGLRIGNAHDAAAATGVTVAIFDRPATASLAIMGGAPGTRESALLEPEMTVAAVDAIVLSGGSAYGLDAAGGVMQALAAQGRGFAIRDVRVPIVPQAILFDLLNGADKPWARGEGEPPHRALAMAAVAASGEDFPLGTVGAGYGATTVNLKGGLGSASAVTRTGHTVGAVVAVNAVGSATVGDGPHFWAAPYEEGGEFGNCGLPAVFDRQALAPRYKGGPGQNTTIALVATDAVLDKAMAKRLAMVAHDGMGRALRPAHAPLDGDLVFAAATGRKPLPEDDIYAFADLGAVAADCLARAIARGVYEATALPLPGALPAWRDLYRPKRPTA